MLGPASEALSPTSPSRSGRHEVKRSITDFTSASKVKGHHTRHSVHHHLRREKHQSDGRELQPAHVSRHRHSIDTPRAEAPAHSRRNSGLAVQIDEIASRVGSSQALAETKANNMDKGEILKKEREKAERRAEDLKQSLVHLHSFSSNASRRLDQTYFAVLEKMSALQNTINALRDLAENSRGIYGALEKDSGELEGDIGGQLDALGRFDEQQGQIEGLQSRIHDGRAKVQALSARIDVVQERIESWERADQHWQDRTRRRLKYIWMVMLIASLAIFVLFLSFRYRTSESPVTGLDEIVAIAADIRKHGQPNGSGFTPPVHDDDGGQVREPLLWTRPIRPDDRLRGLDEL